MAKVILRDMGSVKETFVKKWGPKMEPCEPFPKMLARKSLAENALTWK